MKPDLVSLPPGADTYKLSFRPAIWLLSALFFLAATPFELANSGYGYLIKAVSIGAIIVYAVVLRGAKIGLLNPLILFTLLSFFLANLANLSERVAVALLCIAMGGLLGQARSERWDHDFRGILTLFLSVHAGAMLAAALIFYLTGTVIDLHGMVFPFASRAEGYSSFARLSGLHNEPGSYSQWTLMVLFLLALARGRLFSFWHALIAASVLFTVSLWGIAAVGVFIIAFLVDVILVGRISTKLKRLFGILALTFAMSAIALWTSSELRDDVAQFLEQKASLTTQSGIEKIAASDFFQENFSRVLFFGEPINPGFCPQCLAPQDAGLGQTSTYYIGFTLFAVLTLNIASRLNRLWNLSFVVPALLFLGWKAHIYEPLVWVIWGYVLRGPSMKFTRPAAHVRRGKAHADLLFPIRNLAR